MSNYQVKAINDVFTAAQRFYDAQASLPQREAALRAEYAGERLNDAISVIRAEVSQYQKAMNDTLKNSFASMYESVKDALDKRQSKYLDTPSADFEFLQSPVPLEAQELQKLISRNLYNPLFIRAARKYENENRKHWTEKGANLDYSNPHEKLCRQINETFAYFQSHVSSRGGYDTLAHNPHIVARVDTQLAEASKAAGVKI